MSDRFFPPITQFVNDDASSVFAGGKLEFFVTGTSTNKDTFSDNARTSANTNPVIGDSAGRFGDIFLEPGTYKVTLRDSNDVLKWTADPVAGSVGTSGVIDEKTAAYTVTSDDATKVISADVSSGAFTVTLLAAATAGDGFEITVLKSDSSTAAVTVDGNASETISGATTFLLEIQYGWITIRCDGSNWLVVARGHNHPGVNRFAAQIQLTQGADIANAATLVLGTDGNYFDITGTTGPTTAITVAAGTWFTCQFDGAPTWNHGAALVLPGAANVTFAAGDILTGYAFSANNVRIQSIFRASGRALFPSPFVNTESAATTSGTTVDITGLSSLLNEIHIQLDAVSTDGNNQILLIRLGDSGGFETAGYISTCITQASRTAATNGFLITENAAYDAGIGIYAKIHLIHMGSNVWMYSSDGNENAALVGWVGNGQKTLSGTLTQIRLTTDGGSAAFDAGTMRLVGK